MTTLTLAVGFYDQVLMELLVAVGGALFVGNVLALVRRRREAAEAGDLDHAPVDRTSVYAVRGFIVMMWGFGSLVVG